MPQPVIIRVRPATVCHQPACHHICQALLIDMTPQPAKDGAQGRRQFVQLILDAQARLYPIPYNLAPTLTLAQPWP